MVVDEFHGTFPEDLENLQKLPGVGRSTAGAIASISMGIRAPILDGNVKRVLCRLHAVKGWPGKSAVAKELWCYAERYTPEKRLPEWTQAMMDMGATLCTRTKPNCAECPISQWCEAHAHNKEACFPEPKPKKTLPEKQVRMLMLVNQHGEVLLEKRPPTGIWGGLWSFPESAISENVIQSAENRFGVQLSTTESWHIVRHTFSHYHLDIEPVKSFINSQKTCVFDKQHQWFPIEKTNDLGIPAPIKKLLLQLYQSL